MQIGLRPEIGHHITGHESDGQQNAERHKDHVVKIAENRNEIRDQVDRTEGIGHDADRDELCETWHARVTGRPTSRFIVRAQSRSWSMIVVRFMRRMSASSGLAL